MTDVKLVQGIKVDTSVMELNERDHDSIEKGHLADSQERW